MRRAPPRHWAKVIPKFPNDKATKQLLEEESLANLLIDYMNWISRHVPPRPRKVQIEPTTTADSRWRTVRPAIDALLVKVRNGENLIHFLLNVMGFHHFHLGVSTVAAGHVERTKEVVFAEVTRDKFNVVAIFIIRFSKIQMRLQRR